MARSDTRAGLLGAPYPVGAVGQHLFVGEYLPGLEHGFNEYLPKSALEEAAVMRKRQEEKLSSAADWLCREVCSA